MPRQQRQLAFIAECTADIVHVPGTSNVVADALSRLPDVLACHMAAVTSASDCFSTAAAAVPTVLVYTLMAAAQLTCLGVASLRASSSLWLTHQHVDSQLLFGDTSTGIFRPVAPFSFWHHVFDVVNGIAHPGTQASRRLILARYVWKHAAANVHDMACACLTCQRGKITKHVHMRLEHIPVPSRCFSHVHVDLVGLLPASDGFTYLFTVIDRTMRWAEAVPLQSTYAAACACALFRGWILRFGVPAVMTSDRGTQFTSSLWAALCSLLGIQHVQTTAYHPKEYSLVECFHRRLKEALHAHCTGLDLFGQLPWVMLGLYADACKDTAISPSQAVFGSTVCLPGQLSLESELELDEFLKKMKATLSRTEIVNSRFNTTANRIPTAMLPQPLLDASNVLVHRNSHMPPLAPLYDKPFALLRCSLDTFTILMEDWVEVISSSHLKLCHTPNVVPALPRQCGRPPGPVKQLRLPPR